MGVVRTGTWASLSDDGTTDVQITGDNKKLVAIISAAVQEEIDHVKRRLIDDVSTTPAVAYDKSYTQTYTQYTRDNPMYEMSDYTAVV